jgi:cytochrome c-type biogenesis protein CcmH/NrfG
MKKVFSQILKLIRYSGIYYLLIVGLLFLTVDRKGMLEIRRQYLAGIAANQDFEEDWDNLLFLEYDAIKSPADFAALYMLGIGYFNVKDYRQAERFFRKAQRLKPKSKEVQRCLELALVGKRGEKPEISRFTITYVK